MPCTTMLGKFSTLSLPTLILQQQSLHIKSAQCGVLQKTNPALHSRHERKPYSGPNQGMGPGAAATGAAAGAGARLGAAAATSGAAAAGLGVMGAPIRCSKLLMSSCVTSPARSHGVSRGAGWVELRTVQSSVAVGGSGAVPQASHDLCQAAARGPPSAARSLTHA